MKTAEQKIKDALVVIDFHIIRTKQLVQTFSEGFLKNPTSTLTTGAEDIYMAAAIQRELYQLKAYLQGVLAGNEDRSEKGMAEIDLAAVINIMETERARGLKKLLEFPYRHNSTCVMTNFENECAHRALASFWGNNGRGALCTIDEIMGELTSWQSSGRE